MGKSILATGFLFVASAWAAADDPRGDLRIDPRGETLTIDLGALRSICKDPDAEGFFVDLNGTEIPRNDRKAWTLQLEARPGSEAVIRRAGLRITVTFQAIDKRRAVAWRATCFAEDVAVAAVCDSGDGKWKVAGEDSRLPVWAGNGRVTLDGTDVATLPALVRGSSSAFYVVPERTLDSWLKVAQTCYDAILQDQWALYVSTFNQHDRAQAEKYADCRLYWNAVRRTIEKNDVVEFRFKNINPYGSSRTWRKLMFQRIDDDGKQVGLDTAILLVLEDGEWRIASVSP
ncbi:MAG: hypothetical protein HYY17_04705 [Planctomycetes bacterium]|nr:hypothetical protein [Planctomycetota bacterium]